MTDERKGKERRTINVGPWERAHHPARVMRGIGATRRQRDGTQTDRGGEHPRGYICENCEAIVNLRYIPCPCCGESLAPRALHSEAQEQG